MRETRVTHGCKSEDDASNVKLANVGNRSNLSEVSKFNANIIPGLIQLMLANSAVGEPAEDS